MGRTPWSAAGPPAGFPQSSEILRSSAKGRRGRRPPTHKNEAGGSAPQMPIVQLIRGHYAGQRIVGGVAGCKLHNAHTFGNSRRNAATRRNKNGRLSV